MRSTFTGVRGPLVRSLAAALLLAAPLAVLANNDVSVSVVNGAIVCSPDTLPVGDHKNVNIKWTITTPGWTFTHDGIVIDNNDGEFEELRIEATGTVAHEVDHDDNSTLYKYSVTITDGTHELTVDPAIQNGGHP